MRNKSHYKRRKTRKLINTSIGDLFTKGKPDMVFLGLVGFLLIFGIIMVYDSSAVISNRDFGNQFFFLIKHIQWIAIGLAAGFIAFNFDYHNYPKLVLPALVVTIAALLAVLIAGQEEFGSKRWITVGGFDIQPSELTKLVFTIYLASWLSKQRTAAKVKTFKDLVKNHLYTDLIPFFLITIGICMLILLQPDLGTTAIVGITALIVYFLSGTDFVHTLGSIVIISIMGVLGIVAAILEGYRLVRVKTFLETIKTGDVPDPMESGYQIQQVLIGIGSGGLWGLGFGESRQKYGYLVHYTAFTDTIFAVFAEEFGLIGSTLLILLFLVFLMRGFKIASKAKDKLGAMLALGITVWFGLQIFFNIAANVVLMPLTGIPLPFFSYGGSSMVVVLIAVGILLNISRQSNQTIGRSLPVK